MKTNGNGATEHAAEMEAIKDAEASLIAHLQAEGELGPRALRERASEDRSGSRGDVSLAFWRLLNRGEIILTSEHTVRLSA